MKKKIFMLALSACLIVLSIAGSSLAYFTDVEEQSTVFTAGNVNIELSFTAPTPTGNAYPNQTISAPATIKNTGSEDAYVGAIITFTAGADKDLATIISPAGENDAIPVSIRNFFTGFASADDDTYTVKYTATPGAGGKTTGYTVYVLKNDAVAKGVGGAEGETVTLFSGVKIPYQWDNDEMAVFNGLKISVKAYATQTQGFADNTAATALTTAFTDWSGFAGYTALN